MTAARLLVCTLALAGCATAPVSSTLGPKAPTYRLCDDPQFEGLCTPATLKSTETEPAPVLIDTNLESQRAFRTNRLG